MYEDANLHRGGTIKRRGRVGNQKHIALAVLTSLLFLLCFVAKFRAFLISKNLLVVELIFLCEFCFLLIFLSFFPPGKVFLFFQRAKFSRQKDDEVKEKSVDGSSCNPTFVVSTSFPRLLFLFFPPLNRVNQI